MVDIDDRKEDICRFYANKNLFITGGSGFIGKVIIEKLLRTTDIKGIYCLMRPKRGKSAIERLQVLLQDQAFDKVRQLNSDLFKKVHAIDGDIMEDDLGISKEHSEFLEQNIEIVFHSAATIQFNEPLQLAVKMNVLGTKKLISLCKRMKKLISVVHVSTAYANCDREFIEELIYPTEHKPNNIIDMIQWMDETTLDSIQLKLIGKKPNTYTYTKQLAEYLLVDEASDLPLAILRPSMVTAAWKEPFPGWIDNKNGVTGMYIAYGKGILRALLLDPDITADMIPVDFCVNMLLATGWYTGVHKPDKLLLYHCTSGALNPTTWGSSCSHVKECFKKIPLEGAFRRPRCLCTKTKSLFDYWVVVCHYIPAYLIDCACRLLGKKPGMVSLYLKIYKAIGIFRYFTTRSWQWTHNGMDMLKSVMTNEDAQRFYFDPRFIHWPSYMEDYCMGIKKFILKEKISNVEVAHKQIRRLRNIRYCANAVLLVVFWRLLIANSKLAKTYWYFIMNLALKFLKFFKLSSTMTK